MLAAASYAAFLLPLLLISSWLPDTHCQIKPKYDPTSYLAQVTGPKYSVADVWTNFFPSAKHSEIVKAAPDTWQALPKQFDRTYRNPCWTDEKNRFRCLPYFQIIGVSKCGTTDMYARMKRHPDFALGAKGPHFWDECPYPPRGACTAPPNGDFDGYIDLFERAAAEIHKNPAAITGEASSNTFTGVYTFVRGLARTKGTTVTMAELIYEAQPYQRQVIIMRDPVSRYYSAFHYYRRSSKEPFEPPEKFHERAVKEIGVWNDCVKQFGQLECIKRYEPQQLVKGMYAEFVEAWTSVFPREQLLFMRTEDYKAAPRDHLVTLFKFLGMRNLTETEWSGMVRSNNANSQVDKYPRMLPETRKLLEDFYRPFNAKLAQLLNDERYTWNDKFMAQ